MTHDAAAGIVLFAALALGLAGNVAIAANDPLGTPVPEDVHTEPPIADASDAGLGADGTAPGQSPTPVSDGNAPAPATSDAGIPYRVEFEGALMKGRQGALIRDSSLLLAMQDRPPASISALARRADGDLDRLGTVLRSQGYYDGTVDYAIDEQSDPFLVTLRIARGEPYMLEEFDITYIDADGSDIPAVDEETLGVEINRRARASVIIDAEQRLLSFLSERGYPLSTIVERRHVIDRDAQVIRSRLTVEAGPLLGFGDVSTSGLKDVEEAYVLRIRPWKTGQLYDRRLVDDYRRELLETRLFSAVSIDPDATPDTQGNLPLHITLAERDFRTIGSGFSWGTDEGYEFSAFWEHRNFFHENERVRFETRAGQIEQSLNAFFSKPRFLRRDQTLLVDARLKRFETDAYKETNITGAVGLERELGPLWDGKVGVSGELTDITENQDDRTLFLVGLPGSLIRDSRDDEFDATRGTRLEMAVTPYIVTGDDKFVFFRTEVGGSAYLSLLKSDRLILAGRTRLGSIIGESRSEIPASKRFYTGGGGSIRGYQFQKVGPLDDENDPLGGRSLITLGAELRWRVSERFGVVPFVDGGTVFNEPDFRSDEDETLRWAAGLGFRYYTLIGPIRVDFAVPLNPRDDIDDDFQFYISIGQAF